MAKVPGFRMLVLTALLGCSSLFGSAPAKVWIDTTPACTYAVQGWSDDLLGYIASGDGSGSFDFDPEDEPRTALSGAYDPADGAFDWQVNFDGDYFLDRVDVEGEGTVYHDGDLDLLWTSTTRDVLDQVFTSHERRVREGCDVTWVTWDDGAEDAALRFDGRYQDDATFEWTADYPGYDWRGSIWSDASSQDIIEAEDGSYDYRTDTFADGTQETGFAVDCYDGLRCKGEGERDFDGTSSQSFDVYDGADVVAHIEAEFGYDGDGTQVIAYTDGDTVSCTFDVSDDLSSCSYRCDDGSRGQC